MAKSKSGCGMKMAPSDDKPQGHLSDRREAGDLKNGGPTIPKGKGAVYGKERGADGGEYGREKWEK